MNERTTELPSSEGYLMGADGVRLFHRRVGTGPRLVLYLHGGPGSNFRGSGDLMEPLAQGRTLIMYDQRGSGLSDLLADPDLLTYRHHVRDVESVRRWAEAERVTLIGLSWGAGLAALYADAHPGHVERLLLLSPLPPARTPYFEERFAKLDALRSPAAIERRRALQARLADAPDDETVAICRELSDDAFRLYLANPTPERLAHAALRCDIPPAAIRNRRVVEAATMASLGDWDFRPMLSRIRAPALVIEGQQTNVPLDATVEWATTLPGARLLLLPEAGHESFVDQPESFLAAAGQFLDGAFPSGAEIVGAVDD